MTNKDTLEAFLRNLENASPWESKHSTLCAIAQFAARHGAQTLSALIPTILNILGHDDSQIEFKRDNDFHLSVLVKRAALDALKMIGNRGDTLLTHRALQLFFDPSWMIRCSAIDLLVTVDDNIERLIQQLLLTLHDTDSEVRRCCIRNLPSACASLKNNVSDLQRHVLDGLFMSLIDQEYSVQSEAKSALRQIIKTATLAQEEISSIAARMTHEQDHTREIARELCDCFLLDTDRKAHVIHALISQLKSECLDQQSRAKAADILFQMHAAGTASKNMLIQFSTIQGEELSVSLTEIHCARICHPCREVRQHSILALEKLFDALEWVHQENLDVDREFLRKFPMMQIRQALLTALQDTDELVVVTSIDCIGRGTFKDDELVIERILDLVRSDISVNTVIKAIQCLGVITRSKVMSVRPELLHMKDRLFPAEVQNAISNVESSFDEECECLRARLIASSWDDKLFCIRQLTRKYSRRGPDFVQRWCWNDESASPGDCVLAAIRYGLGLYSSVDDMRRQAPLVGRDGISLGDEAAWRQLEDVFSCAITVLDAFTMNTIRDSPVKMESSAAMLETPIRILVMNGHAFCFRCNVNVDHVEKALSADFECESNIISALVALLQHDDFHVQVSSVTALGAIAKRGEGTVVAGVLDFLKSASGRSVLGSQAAIRALAQISSPGCKASIKALCDMLKNCNIDLQGMSIWAICQVVHNYNLDVEADLAAHIRNSVSEIAEKEEVESLLHKMATWALLRVPTIDSGGFNYPDCRLNANDLETLPAVSDKEHGDCNIFENTNRKKELVNLRLCKSNNQEAASNARDILSNLRSSNIQKVLNALSGLKYINICEDEEVLKSLFQSLENINCRIRSAAIKIITEKAASERSGKVYCELLMKSILGHKYDDVPYQCLIALGKASLPGDNLVSCFIAKQILNKVFSFAQSSFPKKPNEKLMKECDFISAALNILTYLEDAGSPRLKKIAFACAIIDSKDVQDAVVYALEKGILATDLNDYVVAGLVQIVKKAKDTNSSAFSLLQKLAKSGNHKVNLCLSVISQERKESQTQQKENTMNSSALDLQLSPSADMLNRNPHFSRVNCTAPMDEIIQIQSANSAEERHTKSSSISRRNLGRGLNSQGFLQQPRSFQQHNVDRGEMLKTDLLRLRNPTSCTDKQFSFSRVGKMLDRL